MPDDAATFAGVEHLNQRGIIAFAQEALEGGEFAHGGRREQILHADADGGGAFAFEVERVGVGCEAGGFHRSLDPLDRFSFEAGLAVEYAGNGRAGKTHVAGKIRRGTDLRERGGWVRFAHVGFRPEDFWRRAAVSMAALPAAPWARVRGRRQVRGSHLFEFGHLEFRCERVLEREGQEVGAGADGEKHTVTA